MSPREESILNILAKKLAADGAAAWVAPAEVGSLLSPGRAPHTASESASLSRALANLKSAGLIEVDGATRARRIRLNVDSDLFMRWDLTRPPELRQAVPYQKALLGHYVPNQTRWLPESALSFSSAATAGVSPTNYRRVLNSLVIDLTYASSNLENVAISWLDTKALIEFGRLPSGLSAKELKIVLNHKNALRFLCENQDTLELCTRDMFDLHALLMADLLGDGTGIGAVRKNAVYFDGSRYQPISNEFLLREEFEIFCTKGAQIDNPHEKALFIMAFMPYLQPFQDGNKRTSRLAMNIPLIKASLAPFSFTTVDKMEYMFALLAFYERGRIDFLAQVYVDAYRLGAEKYNSLLTLLGDGGTLATLANEPARHGG
jgi:hypothetical protein